jgi:uncharacterized protein
MGPFAEVVIGALIGLFAGIASGLAGVGGGVIMIPAMVFVLGFEQHVAQGTSLLAIGFTALAGTRINRRNAHVDVKLALTIGAIGAAVAFGAARLANSLDGDLLSTLFGAFLILAGARMVVQTMREDRDNSRRGPRGGTPE